MNECKHIRHRGDLEECSLTLGFIGRIEWFLEQDNLRRELARLGAEGGGIVRGNPWLALSGGFSAVLQEKHVLTHA